MAVLLQGSGTVNFEVYYKGTSRLMGLATVELPTFEMETIDMKGNGIAGTAPMPAGPNVGSLELKLTWRRVYEDISTLFGHGPVRLSLYGDQEAIDASDAHFENAQHRVEVCGIPKTFNLGKWEPSATVDSELTLEVVTIYYFIDGREMLAFDRFNYIFRNNGVDYGAAHRRAVGLI